MSGLTLGEFVGGEVVCESLCGLGLSKEAAAAKAKLMVDAAGELLAAGVGGSAEARGFFVPGRIEVLGKHTDYNGGRSIVAAVERGFCLVSVARDDARVRLIDVRGGEDVDFAIDPDLTPAGGHWSNYPMTVARRLARNFAGPIGGAHVAFASDLPAASGMSSSSAMIVAFYLVLARANDLGGRDAYRSNIDDMESLAGYLGSVENGQSFGSLVGDRGVGTFGGSEDHTAILCCRRGLLSQFSYCPVRFERTIAVPEGFIFAIGCSGVVAEKTGNAMEKYNRASRRAAAVLDQWRRATGRDDPHLAAAAASRPDAPAQIRKILKSARHESFSPEDLLDRFEQFYAESEQIVPAAGDALACGDLAEFGRQVDRSQELAEKLLRNQVDQTVCLARLARETGAVAASAFGAGFGGSVWALVRADTADEFLHEWSTKYEKAFPDAAGRSSFFVTSAGPAAGELS